jgi:centractin
MHTFCLDNGTSNIRADWSGMETPRVTGNIIGYPRVQKMVGDMVECYVGYNSNDIMSTQQLWRPMRNGVIQDWEKMEKVWKTILQAQKVDSNQSFYVSETILNPNTQKELMTEIFFERFDAARFGMCSTVLSSLFGSGKTSGMSLCVGEGSTSIGIVNDGSILRSSLAKTKTSSQYATRFFREYLMNEGHFFVNSSSDLEFVRELKETVCGGWNVPRKDDMESKDVEYQLPDGKRIKLSAGIYNCLDIFFNREKFGLNNSGHSNLQNVVDSSIDRCFGYRSSRDVDNNDVREIYENIVLEGGVASIEKCKRKLSMELSSLVKLNESVFKIYNNTPNTIVWKGLSVISQLDSFKNCQLSKQEFHENGASYIIEKSNPLFK